MPLKEKPERGLFKMKYLFKWTKGDWLTKGDVPKLSPYWLTKGDVPKLSPYSRQKEIFAEI